MAQHIPQKGDFVILTFDPQSGVKQKDRRLALVVSNTLFNQHTGLAMVCPITSTSTNQDFPFHVPLPSSSSITGYVMVEQVKSIDYTSRRVKFVENASASLLDDVMAILDTCLYEST